MANNKYLSEAFAALRLLDEETFNVSDDGIAKLNEFTSEEEVAEVEQIIDPLAETEEDLQDSYIGKAILDCTICQSKIYKDPSEVVISEDGSLANIGDICPYCQSSDGFKVIGQVAEYCAECEPEVQDETEVDVSVEEKEDSLEEDLQKVELETDTQKIEIEAKPKDEVSDGEVIAPVSDEIKDQFKTEDEYEEVDFDEFDEEQFDELGEKYLKRVYENVKSYKTTSGSINGNKLKLEGIITFKSGKKGKTNFVFEAGQITKTGKLKFLGENKQFANRRQAFTLTGRTNDNKLIIESLTYNYKAKDNKTGVSKRLYGTVRK